MLDLRSERRKAMGLLSSVVVGGGQMHHRNSYRLCIRFQGLRCGVCARGWFGLGQQQAEQYRGVHGGGPVCIGGRCICVDLTFTTRNNLCTRRCCLCITSSAGIFAHGFVIGRWTVQAMKMHLPE